MEIHFSDLLKFSISLDLGHEKIKKIFIATYDGGIISILIECGVRVGYYAQSDCWVCQRRISVISVYFTLMNTVYRMKVTELCIFLVLCIC